MEIYYLIAGVLAGVLLTWFMMNQKVKASISKKDYDTITSELLITKAGLENEKSRTLDYTSQLTKKDEEMNLKNKEIVEISSQFASAKTKINSLENEVTQLKNEISNYDNEINILQEKNTSIEKELTKIAASLEASNTLVNQYTSDNIKLNEALGKKTNEYNEAYNTISSLTATHNALQEKLEVQKTEFDNLKKQFITEFENIASRILDEKTQKFTNLNKENISAILSPLKENIEDFKKKVEETYNKESNERFSLGKEVEKLMELNNKISEDAINLTQALKGSSKTQGNWGELQLANILEKSGLEKDREYFLQNFIKDKDGKIVVNDDGSKMQPDAIVEFPGKRYVIIDSKVSLDAYVKYCDCENIDEQSKFLMDHIRSIKNHIDNLCKKNYHNYLNTLDFVLMFIPIEPAFIIATKTEKDLWKYAYDKKVMIISPTNLVLSLKMIVDLWKREQQNKNVEEIASRGSKLYDKFVSFIEKFSDIGKNIESMSKNYKDALGQLSEGKGNLVSQVENMKRLGLRTKKQIPSKILNDLETDDSEDIENIDLIDNKNQLTSSDNEDI